MGFVYRKATISDSERIAELFEEMLRTIYHGDFGKTERLFRSSGTLISFETEQQNTLRCG